MDAVRTCTTCGRAMEPRRRWRGREDEVRTCSARCRARRPGPLDRELERLILELLEARAASATVCPSEAARAARPDDWRPLMERTRCAARRLAADEKVEFRAKGRRLDPSHAKGAIRLARGRRFAQG